MYQFLLNMWMLNKIDERKLQTYVPKYITQEQANNIMATPRKMV